MKRNSVSRLRMEIFKLAMRLVGSNRRMTDNQDVAMKMASELVSMFLASQQTTDEDFAVAVCPQGHVSFMAYHLTQEEWSRLVVNGDRAFGIVADAQARAASQNISFADAMNIISAEQNFGHTPISE